MLRTRDKSTNRLEDTKIQETMVIYFKAHVYTGVYSGRTIKIKEIYLNKLNINI